MCRGHHICSKSCAKWFTVHEYPHYRCIGAPAVYIRFSPATLPRTAHLGAQTAYMRPPPHDGAVDLHICTFLILLRLHDVVYLLFSPRLRCLGRIYVPSPSPLTAYAPPQRCLFLFLRGACGAGPVQCAGIVGLLVFPRASACGDVLAYAFRVLVSPSPYFLFPSVLPPHLPLGHRISTTPRFCGVRWGSHICGRPRAGKLPAYGCLTFSLHWDGTAYMRFFFCTVAGPHLGTLGLHICAFYKFSLSCPMVYFLFLRGAYSTGRAQWTRGVGLRILPRFLRVATSRYAIPS